jgi:hypothetical protein
MATGNVTLTIRIDDSVIRRQLRDALREALADEPEMLARFEDSWARGDVLLCRTDNGDAKATFTAERLGKPPLHVDFGDDPDGDNS